MPLEIEAKMKVPDHAVLRDRLRSLDAVPHGQTFELNTFFDTEDRSLLAADRGLRIRIEHHTDPAGRASDQTRVTFKGPRQQSQLKSRDEIEVTVNDAAQMSALFEALGYKTILSFEKRRESWTLNGCKIELDDLPYLGLYAEIEGPNEAHVMKVRDQLGLSDRPMVRASYIALLMTYLQEHGQSGRVVKFTE